MAIPAWTTTIGFETGAIPMSSDTSNPKTPIPKPPWSAPFGWQDALYTEMLSHIEEDDAEPPFPRERFLYYKRTEKGKAYPLHCRKAAPDADEQVILDENNLACGHEFFSLGNLEIDRSERLLAYSTDTEGDEVYVTSIRDLASNSDLDDRIPGSYYSLAWTNDSSTLYYVTLDAAKRPFRVWRHRIGSSEDVLVYEETDQRFELDLDKSRDHRYIFIRSESKTTSEIRFAPADAATPDFRVIWPRRQDILYDVESRRDELYILTNDGAKEFRLVLCPAQNTDHESANEILPGRPGITIESVKAFETFLASSNAITACRVFVFTTSIPEQPTTSRSMNRHLRSAVRTMNCSKRTACDSLTLARHALLDI